MVRVRQRIENFTAQRQKQEILPNTVAIEWMRLRLEEGNNGQQFTDLFNKILAKVNTDDDEFLCLSNASLGDAINHEKYGNLTVVGVDGQKSASLEQKLDLHVVGHDIGLISEFMFKSNLNIHTPSVYKDQFTLIKDMIADYLFASSSKSRYNTEFCLQSLLVSGRAGLGKRSLLVAAGMSLDLPVFYFHLGHELAYKSFVDLMAGSSSLSPLSKLMEEYLLPCSPCILLLDGLSLLHNSDKLWKDFDEGFAALVFTKLSLLRDSLVFIAGTCTDYTKLDGKFKPATLYSISSSKTVFKTVVEMDMPPLERRREFISSLLSRHNCKNESINLENLARITNGLTLKQIDYIISLATTLDTDERGAGSITDTLIENLCNQAVKNGGKTANSDQFFPELPRYKWANMYGYTSLKEKLEQLVVWPLKRPEVYSRLGVTPPSGILLYGPSGCGKTALAHAIADKVSVNFISAKINKIYGKYLGDSELAIRNLFKSARKSAPCILLLDAIHVVGTRREWSDSDGVGGVNERVLSTLLNEMDGIEKSNGVVVIATTNNFDLLDDALTRPGRFDSLIEVPLPTLYDRIDILTGISSFNTLDLSRTDMEGLMIQCEGYTCSELELLVREAGISAMRSGKDVQKITLENFNSAFSCNEKRKNF